MAMTNGTKPAKTAVHIGAGNIGRGFVASFLHNSGYEVVFADVGDPLNQKLNSTPSYKVIEAGVDGTTESVITNYRAINSRTHEEELVGEIASARDEPRYVGPHIQQVIPPHQAKG